MEFFGVARIWAGFVDDALDGVRVQGTEVAGVLGERAAKGDGAGAALFERGVVEVGVGLRVQHLVGEGRGLGSVLGVQADLAGFDPVEDILEAVDVHRLVHAVIDGLADDGVVGDLDGAGLVLLAADELREDRRHQVVGAHALDLRRDLLALALAEDGERAGGVPAPARAEHRRDEQRLLDGLLDPLRLYEVEHVGEREAVVGADREEHRVVAGRRLKLEVKPDAVALAEGEAPGAVDAAAEGCMDDELHATAFVEEALEDDVLLGGDEAEAVAFGADVANDLLGGFGGEVAFVGEPADGVDPGAERECRSGSSGECLRTSGKGCRLRIGP